MKIPPFWKITSLQKKKTQSDNLTIWQSHNLTISPAPLVAKLNTCSGLLNPNWFRVWTRAWYNLCLFLCSIIFVIWVMAPGIEWPLRGGRGGRCPARRSRLRRARGPPVANIKDNNPFLRRAKNTQNVPPLWSMLESLPSYRTLWTRTRESGWKSWKIQQTFHQVQEVNICERYMHK